MNKWATLAVLAPSLALAASASVTAQGDVNVLGWTKDGRYFVWEDPFSGDGSTGYYDAHTFRIGQGGAEKFNQDGLFAPKATGRTSPDGKAKADVKSIASGPGAWSRAKKGEPETWRPGGQTGAELTVERGGHRYVSVSWSGALHEARPYWSPDGRLIAWVLRPSAWAGMDGSAEFEIVIGSGGFPRVHVVAGQALLDGPARKVADALGAGGFTVTYLGKAMKERDQSVVYAAPGLEAEAAKAAALVPGGATVEKLTWKAATDLVVAVGSKAKGGAK